jgi:tRNA(fMet)-specific endonuclease VapC
VIFLDSDICIHFLNGKDLSVLKKFQEHKPGDLKIASIVQAELLFGVQNSKKKLENSEKLSRFLEPYEIVSFDDRAAAVYAQVRFELAKKGTLIGPNDLILAATVIANNGSLVTRNVGEFKRLARLKLEAW